MTIVNQQFDPVLRRLISEKNQVAIIPVGSIEQHGPHLPISTDSDIVSEIAKKVSEKNDYLLLPTINYGVSFEHAPFFNLSVTNSTLQRVLIDIIVSLASNKIKTVFIINGHHGNIKSLQSIPHKITKLSKGKIKVFVLSYWHFLDRDFDHAGFVETSLMLAISKNVKMSLAKKGFTTDALTRQKRLKIAKLASRSFISVTKNGIWGDPRKANMKEGKKMLAKIIKNLQKKCQTCLTGKRPKLHQ